MTYALAVLAGVLLAALVRRLVPRASYPHAGALAAVAVVGALGGALLGELPADWMGWTATVDGASLPHRLGGRTLLGGLLGGWIAVEAAKRPLGVGVPTGDSFVAPLAAALACGRVGCALTGCCPGRASDGARWWAPLALRAPDGVLRFPASWVEVAFHGLAAAALVVALRRGLLPGRLFAGYVALYCVVRVALEEVREDPPVLGGWTYYQLLAVPLFALAAATLVHRRRGSPEHGA